MHDGRPRGLGIAWDSIGWWRRYKDCAEAAGMDYEVFEMERSDWARTARRYRVVLWRANLDPPFCDEAKEKIYFMERFLGLRVIPNWDTFWHYDNKRAQAYLFALQDVPSPWTFVSYSAAEVQAQAASPRYPIVSKRADGASSDNVRLLGSPSAAARERRRAFHQPLWIRALRRLGIHVRLTSRSQSGYVLWQEFVPANERDLRITVIGGDRVFAFWRHNRPGDFRASGSGLIDYNVDHVEEECLACLDICHRNNFDSMAFDLVYQQNRFVVLEMSCAFNAEAIHQAPGHFRLVDPAARRLERVTGHVWPQALQVDYARRILAEDLLPSCPAGPAREG